MGVRPRNPRIHTEPDVADENPGESRYGENEVTASKGHETEIEVGVEVGQRGENLLTLGSSPLQGTNTED